MYSVLKLNSDYTPLEIISWQAAIGLWYKNKVDVIEHYDDFNLSSPTLVMQCPSVIRLVEYAGFRRNAKYSRGNIYSRDRFTCQYCACQPGSENLNLDHVIPKKMGGATTWENIVASCIPCNSKKAMRTPKQAGMKLLRKPVRPNKDRFIENMFKAPQTPEAWRNYLYWEQELENDNKE